jgi:signal transduction histidine kinase
VTRARKGVPAGRRLAVFGRVALAIGLLAAVAAIAVTGIGNSEKQVKDERLADRVAATRATAGSLAAWIDAGRAEAKALAASLGAQAPGRATVDFLAGPHAFASDALVTDRRGAVNGVVLRPCLPENDLGQLVAAVPSNGDTVALPHVFDKPPSCNDPVVGIAAAQGGSVAIVLARPADVIRELAPLTAVGAGTRAFLVDPTGRAVGSALPALSGPPKPGDGYQLDGPVGAQVVSSYSPVGDGWSLLLEQDKATFFPRSKPQNDPRNRAAVAAAACLAVAIIVVGVFDARRRRALARAEEVRSQFLAVVSHELRTPLTVLKGFVETLLARWDHFDDTQREQLVERLAPQVRRLHRGVDRLLLAADIQRGANLRLENEKIALREVVADVVDGFRPLAPLHAFTVDVPDDLTVVADRKALTQALDQVVDNAVKYSPAGGSVNVRARRASRRIELVVEDEGVGLPSDASRIFDPLSQGEDVDTRVHDEGGVGVGLYIARALVDAMGGSVRAERRTPEPGTRLAVTLVAGPLRAQGGEQLAPSGRVHGQF